MKYSNSTSTKAEDRNIPKDLVVLGEALRAAGCAGLDLASRETDDKVCDERVLGLTTAVTHLESRTRP